MPLTREKRFWSKVDKVGRIPSSRPDLGNCWIWLASDNSSGYGQFYRTRKEGMILAHVFSWELVNGSKPIGMEIDHLCSVRNYVNPSHLELVTHRENSLRSNSIMAIQARRTHCPQGHPYDSVNTRIYRNKKYCRACYYPVGLK